MSHFHSCYECFCGFGPCLKSCFGYLIGSSFCLSDSSLAHLFGFNKHHKALTYHSAMECRENVLENVGISSPDGLCVFSKMAEGYMYFPVFLGRSTSFLVFLFCPHSPLVRVKSSQFPHFQDRLSFKSALNPPH